MTEESGRLRRTLETGPLRGPVDESEVRLFRRQVRRTGEPTSAYEVSTPVAVAWLAAGLGLPLFGAALLATAFQVPTGWSLLVGALVFLGVLALGFLRLRAVGAIGLDPWRDRLRCVLFAASNQLVYEDRAEALDYPGVIFTAGWDKETVRRIRSESGPYLDCGTHRYVVGSDRRQERRAWQFAAYPLPGTLPCLLLNSRLDHALSGDLGEFGAPERRQTLGGEIDEYFDLRCQPEDLAGAYYVLTPDLMALIIDHARDFDLEVVGSWLFLYSRSGLTVSDPNTWARLAVIEDKILPLVRDRARSFGDRAES